jgi:hypothetical protein
MTLENGKPTKQPRGAEQPFPWRCNHCGKKAVNVATIEYTAQVRHKGRLCKFTVPDLRIPVCDACGERVFTEEVDRQVNNAFLYTAASSCKT